MCGIHICVPSYPKHTVSFSSEQNKIYRTSIRLHTRKHLPLLFPFSLPVTTGLPPPPLPLPTPGWYRTNNIVNKIPVPVLHVTSQNVTGHTKSILSPAKKSTSHKTPIKSVASHPLKIRHQIIIWNMWTTSPATYRDSPTSCVQCIKKTNESPLKVSFN
jgi:hypothetical protein